MCQTSPSGVLSFVPLTVCYAARRDARVAGQRRGSLVHSAGVERRWKRDILAPMPSAGGGPSAASLSPTRCWRGTTIVSTGRLRAKTRWRFRIPLTTPFLLAGELIPKVQPCDGLVNKVFKSNMTAPPPYSLPRHQTPRPRSSYPEPPSRGLFQGVAGAVDEESLR